MRQSFIQNYGRIALLIAVGMAILFLDFVSKAYIYHVFPYLNASRGFVPELLVFKNFLGIDFYISLTINRGAAWGLFANFQIVLLCVRILVIVALFLYLFFLNKNRAAQFPLVLVLAGAIGNIVDFFLYGFVIDFLRFNLWGYHFPVFNLADTSITIGVIWLFLVALFQKKDNGKKYLKDRGTSSGL